MNNSQQHANQNWMNGTTTGTNITLTNTAGSHQWTPATYTCAANVVSTDNKN